MLLNSSVCGRCKFFFAEEGSIYDYYDEINHFENHQKMICGVNGSSIHLELDNNNSFVVDDSKDNNFVQEGICSEVIKNNCPYILEHTLSPDKQEAPTLASLLEQALKKK